MDSNNETTPEPNILESNKRQIIISILIILIFGASILIISDPGEDTYFAQANFDEPAGDVWYDEEQVLFAEETWNIHGIATRVTSWVDIITIEIIGDEDSLSFSLGVDQGMPSRGAVRNPEGFRNVVEYGFYIDTDYDEAVNYMVLVMIDTDPSGIEKTNTFFLKVSDDGTEEIDIPVSVNINYTSAEFGASFNRSYIENAEEFQWFAGFSFGITDPIDATDHQAVFVIDWVPIRHPQVITQGQWAPFPIR